MSEFEPTPPAPNDEKPTTRKVGEEVMRVTYLPPVAPETVREHDGIDHEYLGKSPRLQAYAHAANTAMRRRKYRRQS